MRIRGDVEIFGMQIEQGIAHAAPDQERIEAGIVQPIENFECVFGDVGPRQRMIGSGNDGWTGTRPCPVVIQMIYRKRRDNAGLS